MQEIKGLERYYSEQTGLNQDDAKALHELQHARKQKERLEVTKWKGDRQDVHWYIKITCNKQSTHPVTLEQSEKSVLIAQVVTSNKTDSRIKNLQTVVMKKQGKREMKIHSVLTRERFIVMFERMLQELDQLINRKFPGKSLQRVWMHKSTMMSINQYNIFDGQLCVDPIRDINFMLTKIKQSTTEGYEYEVYERECTGIRR